MSRHPRHDILFEPLAVGPKTLPNRFWQTPQCNGAGSERPRVQAAFRGVKAEGGWGAVFTEVTTIAPEADIAPLVAVRLWDDEDVQNLRAVTDAIHAHGSLAGVELYYGGMAPIATDGRAPHGACGATAGPRIELDHASAGVDLACGDLPRIVGLYAAAARRARAAGYDLISLYCAHGVTILHQMLLPLYNQRDDEYGGSLEHRAKLTREVAQAVRLAVGDDCAVGIRFTPDTIPPPYGPAEGGMHVDDEGHRVIEQLDDVVDYWDITLMGAEEMGSSRTHPENHEAVYTGRIKRHTAKPVVNVGRFTSPDTMAAVLRNGQCDIIGAARPSIADPFLPRKIRDGRYDELRECIGCNMCISRWEQSAPIVCTQNPTAGEEYRRGWHPEHYSPAGNRDNDVLVIGAGPAGMECAMVLGKRGMRRIHLVDSAPEIGGHLRWVTHLPGLGEWGRVIAYRQVQLARLPNVSVRPGLSLNAAAVLDYGAELVVVATGSHWAGDGLNGTSQRAITGADAALGYVATPEQIMVEGKPLGGRVVVYDTDGYYMGPLLAEKLARDGHEVLLVTPSESLARYTVFTFEYRRIRLTLHELGVTIMTGQQLIHVSDGVATTVDVWHGERIDHLCDSVVVVTQRVPDAGLFRTLTNRRNDLIEAGITGLYQVGDCVQPSFIAQAVFSGHRLAREIDTPDPAVALPYLRERDVVPEGGLAAPTLQAQEA